MISERSRPVRLVKRRVDAVYILIRYRVVNAVLGVLFFLREKMRKTLLQSLGSTRSSGPDSRRTVRPDGLNVIFLSLDALRKEPKNELGKTVSYNRTSRVIQLIRNSFGILVGFRNEQPVAYSFLRRLSIYYVCLVPNMFGTE